MTSILEVSKKKNQKSVFQNVSMSKSLSQFEHVYMRRLMKLTMLTDKIRAINDQMVKDEYKKKVMHLRFLQGKYRYT